MILAMITVILPEMTTAQAVMPVTVKARAAETIPGVVPAAVITAQEMTVQAGTTKDREIQRIQTELPGATAGIRKQKTTARLPETVKWEIPEPVEVQEVEVPDLRVETPSVEIPEPAAPRQEVLRADRAERDQDTSGTESDNKW